MKTDEIRYTYVYQTINKITKQTYTGCTSQDLEGGSGYIGSGKEIKEAIKEYGKENFTVNIIGKFERNDVAKAVEREIIGDHWKNINSYNAVTGGGGPDIHTEEAKRKISESHMGANNPAYGRTGDKHPMARSVTVKGVQYTTCKEAAKANGVTPATLGYWLKTRKNESRYL